MEKVVELLVQFDHLTLTALSSSIRLFGGPFLAVIMGFGAAYASKTAGPAGRTARAIGDVGVSLYEKAVELDDQHHIVAQSKVIAKDAWVKLKEVNEEHEVVKQLSGFLSFAVGATVEFVRRHRLMEGAIAGIQGILRSVFCEDTKKES